MDTWSLFFFSNNLVDSLDKVGAILDSSTIPLSLSPLISSQRLSSTPNENTVSSLVFSNIKSLYCLLRSLLSLFPLAVFSRLRCNGHSSFLASYLYRIGRAETASCSNCGSESQDILHLVLDCPAFDSLCRAIFGHPLSILDLWSSHWGLPNYWDSVELIRIPIFRSGSGKLPPPPPPDQGRDRDHKNRSRHLYH